MGFEGAPERLRIVVVDAVGLGDAPHLAAGIVLVDGKNLPAVLVDVKGAAFVDVRGTGLQGGFDDPDAVELVAGEVLVDVKRLEDVGVFHRAAVQFVGIVGNNDFLFADELPFVAVGSAVIHVELVAGAHAVGGGAGVVIGNIGGAAHAALAGVVDPGVPFFFHLVEGLVGKENGAGLAGGSDDGLLVVDENVIELGGSESGADVVEEELILELDEGVTAAAGGGGLADVAGGGDAAVAREVIPHDLEALSRNREWHADDGVFERVAVVGEDGGGGVGLGGVVDPLGVGNAATGGVDDELVGRRIGFEQGDGAGGELGLVLGEVGRGDREARLIGGEWIGVVIAGFVAGRRRENSAVPSGDGAGGVAGGLSAEGREVAAEAGGFAGGDGGVGRGGEEREEEGAGEKEKGGEGETGRAGSFFHGDREGRG